MSTTTPLSVGEVLDKLRSTDPPKPKLAKLDEDLETLRRETQRLRAARRKLQQGRAAELNANPTQADP
jgi:hypothetical protein